MDWTLFIIAALLTLSGLYFLESEQALTGDRVVSGHRLRAPVDTIERAWRADPVQVFMRQIMATRRRRHSNLWPMDKGWL